MSDVISVASLSRNEGQRRRRKLVKRRSVDARPDFQERIMMAELRFAISESRWIS